MFDNYNARKDGKYEKIWRKAAKRCVFCDLKSKYLVAEKKNAVLTVNLFPYIDGHLMVIPKRHFETFSEINEKEWRQVSRLTKLGVDLLRKDLGVRDIWVLFRDSHGFGAEKTVKHAHWHIFPYTVGMYMREEKEITIPPIELAKRLRGLL